MKKLGLVILAIMILQVLLAATGCGGLPQVSFEASTISGRVPLNVSITNTTSGVNSDSNIVFDWDFGDGNSQKATVVTNAVSHNYIIAGTYTVTLTEYKSDSPSNTMVATKTITVTQGTSMNINIAP
jgi:PKD repeat protein